MATLAFNTGGDDPIDVNIRYDKYGTGTYQVMYNNHLEGWLDFTDGRWQLHPSKISEITTEDIQLLGAMVDEAGGLKAD